jgi:hypothetical protein
MLTNGPCYKLIHSGSPKPSPKNVTVFRDRALKEVSLAWRAWVDPCPYG